MTRALPPWLDQLIDSPPAAGQGIHSWLFRVSRQLHAHMPAGEIVALLADRVRGCGRHVPQGEIVQAVQHSLAFAWQPRGAQTAYAPSHKWPGVDKARIEAITAEGFGLADLWEASPIRLDDSHYRAEEIVDALFPGNPLLCCGKSSTDFATRRREEWRGQLTSLQYVVPSPMNAPTGTTRDGRESAHTLANTGPRRFLVVEFDQGDIGQQAALLLHLTSYAPMVCALHSGGKSLHGWFRAGGHNEDKVRRFFAYAVSLGADDRMWTRSQFARMPDGTRDDGRRQTVYYFHPNLLSQ